MLSKGKHFYERLGMTAAAKARHYSFQR